MFGVPIDGLTDMFCENELLYKNASMPESQLQKKHHSIIYHMSIEYVASRASWIAREDTETNLADLFTKVFPRPRRELLLNKFTYWIKARDEISNQCIVDRYIGWGGITNPVTMGYISVLIPLIKVNRVEEGIGNTEYILLWFYRNQRSRIRIESSYPMTYSDDGIYVPIDHGGTPVTVTRNGRGDISRLCCTSMDKSQVSIACDRD